MNSTPAVKQLTKSTRRHFEDLFIESRRTGSQVRLRTYCQGLQGYERDLIAKHHPGLLSAPPTDDPLDGIVDELRAAEYELKGAQQATESYHPESFNTDTTPKN